MQGWRRLTRIANDELEKFRLNFSRCTNRDVAPLSRQLQLRALFLFQTVFRECPLSRASTVYLSDRKKY